MVLVADSGSTKTNWCLLKPKEEVFYFDTEGYNPYFVDSPYIVESLNKQLPKMVNHDLVSDIHFYGAGCFEDKVDIIKHALLSIFPHAVVHIGLDLLGSARSVLGDKPGFAAILGTGTNSCIYDGEKITENIDSLGYLLGDEGSGYYIGRKLLGDYIRDYMPATVKEAFYEVYGLTREEIMERVYTEKLPNRFCSSFTLFISECHADPTYTNNLVKASFVDFFESLVIKYKNYHEYNFNCTGSIANAFKEILAETAAQYKMEMGVILKTPIEGLALYHLPENYK